ncbi:hypothetical protein ACMAZF_17615 [Psychrobium sp. nBUS_13]|uniref:hypothetical protein n=1 Tax=Psychrobium sp. nBUS_13 TaxID=3395319 RepID=UPI003EBA3C5A
MKNSLYSLILIGFFLSFDANSVAHNGGNYNDRVSTECDSDCQKDAQINHQNILNWLENITSPVVNREESHSEYLAHLFEGRETNTTVVIANEKTFKNSRGLCLIKADLILKKNRSKYW